MKKETKETMVKLAFSGLLATSVTTAAAIHDASIDHTKELCPITKLLNKFYPTLGLNHQISEIRKDYKDKGIDDVHIVYGDVINEYTCTEYYHIISEEEAEKKDANKETVTESGKETTIYSCPVGYTREGTKCYKEFVTACPVGYTREGTKCYKEFVTACPVGSTLYTSEDGPVCRKQTTAYNNYGLGLTSYYYDDNNERVKEYVLIK